MCASTQMTNSDQRDMHSQELSRRCAQKLVLKARSWQVVLLIKPDNLELQFL